MNHFLPPGTQGKLGGALGRILADGMFMEGTKAMSRPVSGFHARFPYLPAGRKLRAYCRREATEARTRVLKCHVRGRHARSGLWV